MFTKLSFSTAMILFLFLLSACQQETIEPEQTETPHAFTGDWEGEIIIPMQPLSIEILIDEDQATLSIPVQGIFDEPFDTVELDEQRLSLETTLQGQTILFEGEREEEEISGEFTQLGQQLPFQLRFQEEEELTELTLDSSETMKAKIDFPQEEQDAFPVALILQGSGPTDKHGNSYLLPGRNDNLKFISEHLNENSIATIRYDKRGIGDNLDLAPTSAETTFDDYIQDAIAWLEYASQNESFTSVYVIGHSEGALVGLAAALEENVDAYFSLAGAGRTIDDVLLEQIEEDPLITDELLQESADIIDHLSKGDSVDEISLELQSLFNQSVQPFLSSWMAYDPAELIQDVTFPTFIIHGENDQQIPVDDAHLLHDANNDTELLLIEDMGHALRDVSEDIEEEALSAISSEEPVSEELLEILTTRILNQSD